MGRDLPRGSNLPTRSSGLQVSYWGRGGEGGRMEESGELEKEGEDGRGMEGGKVMEDV